MVQCGTRDAVLADYERAGVPWPDDVGCGAIVPRGPEAEQLRDLSVTGSARNRCHAANCTDLSKMEVRAGRINGGIDVGKLEAGSRRVVIILIQASKGYYVLGDEICGSDTVAV